MAFKHPLGREVYRPADAIVIAATPGHVQFTVTGLVLVTALIGQITEAPGAAQTLSYELAPTAAGAATPFIICAPANLNTSVPGDVFALVGAPATGLAIHLSGVLAGLTIGTGLVLSAGPIGLVATNNVGQFNSWLYYIPISANGLVVAA